MMIMNDHIRNLGKNKQGFFFVENYLHFLIFSEIIVFFSNILMNLIILLISTCFSAKKKRKQSISKIEVPTIERSSNNEIKELLLQPSAQDSDREEKNGDDKEPNNLIQEKGDSPNNDTEKDEVHSVPNIELDREIHLDYLLMISNDFSLVQTNVQILSFLLCALIVDKGDSYQCDNELNGGYFFSIGASISNLLVLLVIQVFAQVKKISSQFYF